MFPVLLNPCGLPSLLVKNTLSSEAVCLLYPHSPLCKLDAHRNVLCDKNVRMMFLHAGSLHSTERIKWRLELFADWEIIWPIVRKRLHCHKVHSLHSQLNDFILAAIEWAQRDFGFCFSVHDTNTVYYYHTPRFFFFFFHSLFSYNSQRKRQCYSPCTWFLHIQGKKTILWIWCLLNQVP